MTIGTQNFYDLFLQMNEVTIRMTEHITADTSLRDTVIRVDLSAIAQNMKNICALVGPDVAVAAVIKANGYGHGALALAPVLMENGASLLAVATLGEALELKKAYPDYPVLIMGLTPDRCLSYVGEYNIIQTIDTVHQARLLNQIGEKNGRPIQVHLKIDTGFHRIGFSDDDKTLRSILELKDMPWLNTDGIFSHLALFNETSDQEQFDRFTNAVSFLESNGFRFRCRHMADSIALVDSPQYRLDMVRAGALIYGLKGFHKGFVSVKQALTFETKISHISLVPAGEGVSYDYTWRADKDTRVATLPFGYADGYPRNLRGKGFVTIRGVRCPIIGVICMDQCMADLTNVPDAAVGDTAIIYGDGSNNTADIQEISELAQTNKNEIVSRLSLRPLRIYETGRDCF